MERERREILVRGVKQTNGFETRCVWIRRKMFDELLKRDWNESKEGMGKLLVN